MATALGPFSALISHLEFVDWTCKPAIAPSEKRWEYTLQLAVRMSGDAVHTEPHVVLRLVA